MSDISMKSAWMSIEDAAVYLSVNPRTIRRRISDGTLPAAYVRGTRAVRLRRDDVEALLDPIPSAATP